MKGSAASSGEDPLLCLWVEAIEGEVGVTDQSREPLDTANTAGITRRNQRIRSPPLTYLAGSFADPLE
jgi:hypothetical protein